MSPCMAETVKSRWCIFSVSQSTFLLVLQKITACQSINDYLVYLHDLRGAIEVLWIRFFWIRIRFFRKLRIRIRHSFLCEEEKAKMLLKLQHKLTVNFFALIVPLTRGCSADFMLFVTANWSLSDPELIIPAPANNFGSLWIWLRIHNTGRNRYLPSNSNGRIKVFMEAKIFISEIFFNSKSKVEKKKPEPIAAYHFVTGSCTGTVPY